MQILNDLTVLTHCQQLSLNHFFDEDMIHINIRDSMILWSSKDTFLKPGQIQQKLQYAVSFWGDTARGHGFNEQTL